MYHQVLTNGVYKTPLGLCMSTKPEERDASWSHWRFAVDRTKTSQRSYGSQDVANQDDASEASGNPVWLTCTQLWNYSFIYIYIPFSYYFKIHYLCITKGHICFSGLWGAAGSEVTRCLRSPRVWRPPFSRWNTIWTSTKRTAWLSWVGLWVFIPFNVIAIIFAAEIFHVSITGKPSMGRP